MTQQLTPLLPEWRCIGCRSLLARVIVRPGSVVEIRCRKCNTLNVIDKRKAA